MRTKTVLGVVVGRAAACDAPASRPACQSPIVSASRDDEPAGRRHPRRLEHVGARDVAPAGGHLDPVGRNPERAGAAIEQRAEHARPVKPRQAKPFDRAVGSDQRPRVAIREERVVGDRREVGAVAEFPRNGRREHAWRPLGPARGRPGRRRRRPGCARGPLGSGRRPLGSGPWRLGSSPGGLGSSPGRPGSGPWLLGSGPWRLGGSPGRPGSGRQRRGRTGRPVACSGRAALAGVGHCARAYRAPRICGTIDVRGR